jgi:hypothetical protein
LVDQGRLLEDLNETIRGGTEDGEFFERAVELVAMVVARAIRTLQRKGRDESENTRG